MKSNDFIVTITLCDLVGASSGTKTPDPHLVNLAALTTVGGPNCYWDN